MKPLAFIVGLGGERLRFRADGDDELAALLRPLHSVPGSASGTPDIEIRWSDGRGQVRRRGRLHHRGTSRHDLVLEAEWVATNDAMARLRGRALILHAAWTARGRDGILVAGAHGRGKTSLAAALAIRHRWRLLSDDLTLASPSGALSPFERPLRLKRGIRTILPETASIGIDLAPWKRGWPALAPWSRFSGRGPADLRAIVLLGARKSGPLTLRRLEAGVALGRLARLAFNFADDPAVSLRTLAILTSKAPAVELSGGTIDQRCAALRRML